MKNEMLSQEGDFEVIQKVVLIRNFHRLTSYFSHMPLSALHVVAQACNSKTCGV
jgi:hypothetical protein